MVTESIISGSIGLAFKLLSTAIDKFLKKRKETKTNDKNNTLPKVLWVDDNMFNNTTIAENFIKERKKQNLPLVEFEYALDTKMAMYLLNHKVGEYCMVISDLLRYERLSKTQYIANDRAGFELFERMNRDKLLCDIPFAIFTGYISKENRDLAESYGIPITVDVQEIKSSLTNSAS